jgi:hypothetical protein
LRHAVDFVDPRRAPVVHGGGQVADLSRHVFDVPRFVGADTARYAVAHLLREGSC